MNEIFLRTEKPDLCNYADNSSLYTVGNLKKNFLWISNCFHDCYMVLNSHKYNSMILGDTNKPLNLSAKEIIQQIQRSEETRCFYRVTSIKYYID